MRSVVGIGRASVASADGRRPPLHVLHIGKTGGTALKHVLMENEATSRYRLLFRGHRETVADVPRGAPFMFLIRDPVSRFVSAFNGRLREDRPRYYYPWRDAEREAFAVFRTPDQLARALSSADPDLRHRAERGMRAIGHVNTPYSFWLGNERALLARLPDLFFVGSQERLDHDFENLKRKLGLPVDAFLPTDDEAAHRTPDGFETELSRAGRANVARWYANDVKLVALCRRLASRVNGSQAAERSDAPPRLGELRGLRTEDVALPDGHRDTLSGGFLR